MSRALSSDVQPAVESVREDTGRFLCDLIRIPSLPGSEARAVEYAGKRFAELAQVEPVALSNAIRQDPDYSDPIAGLEYDGRSNLRVRLPGSGKGRKLLLNTHLDVVPPS